tara:strand:- start:6456 stop:6782 length:327 start_codon:yes stop_codon:yes gene_type:complete
LPTNKKLWKEDLDGIITGYFPTEVELVAYTKKTLKLNLPIFQFSPVLRDHKIAKEIIDLAKVRNKLIFCYNPYQYSRTFREIHDQVYTFVLKRTPRPPLLIYKAGSVF